MLDLTSLSYLKSVLKDSTGNADFPLIQYAPNEMRVSCAESSQVIIEHAF